MRRKITTTWLEKALTAISDLNIQIHTMRLENASDPEQENVKLSNQYCTITPDKLIVDGQDFSLYSTYSRAQDIVLTKQRDKLIQAFHAQFLANVKLMYPNITPLRIIFGITEKAAPTIYMEIDNLSLHPRPVSIKYFVRILETFIAHLDFNKNPDQKLRKFTIFLNGETAIIRAPSQSQALWKFLCIKQKELAADIVAATDPEEFVIDPEFLENFRACYILEDMNIRDTLIGCTRSQYPVPFLFPHFNTIENNITVTKSGRRMAIS